MIIIVDYGMGNLGSVFNMFKKIGTASKITSDLEDIKTATKLLLPGVGSFDKAMCRLNDSGIKKILAWGTSNYDSKTNPEYDD